MQPTENEWIVFEGFSLTFKPAPLLRRVMAYVVDLAIVTLLLYLFLMILFFVVLGGFATARHFSNTVLIVAVVILFFGIFGIYHGYFVWSEYKTGKTLGKKIFGLQVISTNSAKLKLGQCVLRDLLKLVDVALIFPGLISILVSKKGERLGDLVAGTLVVYSVAEESKNEFIYLNQNTYFLFLDVLKPSAVPKETARQYLATAHKAFIAPKKDPAATSALDDWNEEILKWVPALSEHPVDFKTRQLFFAEHCLQQLNNRGD